MTPSRLTIVLATAGLCLSAIPQAAHAGSPSAADLIQALRPAQADDVTGSRTLNDLLDERGITSDETEEVPSIDVRVNFAFDSIKLENETLLTLRALGNALTSDDLAGQRIEIVGHTDGKGTEAYNDDLSKRRAAAVVDYLVANYGVSPDMVTSDGRGERELLYPDEPENELNRRVQIRNITGAGEAG